MVTFICYHCNETMKKPQVEKHLYKCRKPAKFICIDCKNTFNGDEHKAHEKCLTEKELYWGQYAKGKPQKPAQQPVVEKQDSVTEEQIQWPGWRNFINNHLKESSKKQIKLDKVKQVAVKEFLKHYPEVDQNDAEEQFDAKVTQGTKYAIETVSYIVKKQKL